MTLYINGKQTSGSGGALDIDGLTLDISVTGLDTLPFYSDDDSANRKCRIIDLPTMPEVIYELGNGEEQTFPSTPVNGDVFEVIGVGVNWTVTANSGQYIRNHASESASGGTISSSNGYDQVKLIYVSEGNIESEHDTWLVVNSMGVLEIDAE